jgi:hypothetical protein
MNDMQGYSLPIDGLPSLITLVISRCKRRRQSKVRMKSRHIPQMKSRTGRKHTTTLPETGEGHGIARNAAAVKMNPESFAMIL